MDVCAPAERLRIGLGKAAPEEWCTDHAVSLDGRAALRDTLSSGVLPLGAEVQSSTAPRAFPLQSTTALTFIVQCNISAQWVRKREFR